VKEVLDIYSGDIPVNYVGTDSENIGILSGDGV
jgi:hypothetical protein